MFLKDFQNVAAKTIIDKIDKTLALERSLSRELLNLVIVAPKCPKTLSAYIILCQEIKSYLFYISNVSASP